MRITQKDLEELTQRINEMTENPLEPFTQSEDGKFHRNPGNYHLSYAYGGVTLHQMGAKGGIREIIAGYRPKRELYEKMQSLIAGLSLCN